MAKTKRRWLVRECYAVSKQMHLVGYELHVGRRPYLDSRGIWIGDPHATRHLPMHVERLLAPKWHLPPGGGPVELEG